MCGAPKTQEVVTRTELDPALQRQLYGGTLAQEVGLAAPLVGARLAVAVAATTMAETLA